MRLSVFCHHILEAAKQTQRPLDDIMRDVRCMGISCVEADLSSLQADDSLAERLQNADLSIETINAFFDLGHEHDAKVGLDLVDEAARRGVGNVLIVPGFMREGETPNDVLPRMVSALNDICAYAQAVGVRVGIEDFDAREAPYATLEQLTYLFDAVPPLGCVFDTGNFIFSEEDALEAYERLKPRVCALHLKDRSPVCLTSGDTPIETILGRKLYPAPVGGGCLPMNELLRALRRDGYDGALAIEHYGAADQFSYIEESAKWVLSAWENAKPKE